MTFKITYTSFFRKESSIDDEKLEDLFRFSTKNIEKFSGLDKEQVLKIKKAWANNEKIHISNEEYKKLQKAVNVMYRA